MNQKQFYRYAIEEKLSGIALYEAAQRVSGAPYKFDRAIYALSGWEVEVSKITSPESCSQKCYSELEYEVNHLKGIHRNILKLDRSVLGEIEKILDLLAEESIKENFANYAKIDEFRDNKQLRTAVKSDQLDIDNRHSDNRAFSRIKKLFFGNWIKTIFTVWIFLFVGMPVVGFIFGNKSSNVSVRKESYIHQDYPSQNYENSLSQHHEYMRILGSLRWDQLTSKNEWINRFPGCLKHSSITDSLIAQDSGKCETFLVGGIPLSIERIWFATNSSTPSNSMTTSVRFVFFDDSQSRVFKRALKDKYDYTHSVYYCSKYTCWDLGDAYSAGAITAEPTSLTVSVLDDVEVDSSEL